MYVVYVYLCNNIDDVCLKNKSSKAYALKYTVSLSIVRREHNHARTWPDNNYRRRTV